VAFARSKPADGVKAPFPDFVEPALASSIERVPSGERWIHEIKFDGYRDQTHILNDAVKIFTRRGHDWTHRFKKAAHDAWRIKAKCAVVDGEIVVPAADGTTDFSVLQNELKGSSDKIVLVAFDLLYLDGRDLRRLPVRQRKAALKKIVAGTDVQFSESFEIEGAEMFAHACKLGMEGVVSKGRRLDLSERPQQRLGQEALRAARDADHRWFRPRRHQVGRALRRAEQGQRSRLRR
jgi:bifunctional non-homologous end joining protein LigD